MNGYKLLGLFLVLNITFQLISDVTAGKIIALAGFGVSITVLYFPVTYIISDVLTEVYGYAIARKVLWLTVVGSVIAGLTYQLVAFFPPANFFKENEAYETVFYTVPRILVGGWLAVFAGDIANNYTLAKMKLWTSGRYLWARVIGSTIVGQFLNTAVFYVVGLYGILELDNLIQSITAGWLLKTVVEVCLLPITYFVIRTVKRIEGVDFYDYETDFNPFRLYEQKKSVKVGGER